MGGVKFCPQCGAGALGADPQFCASCGHSLPLSSGPSREKSPHPPEPHPPTESPSTPRLQTCFKCRVPFDTDQDERCPRCFPAAVARTVPSQSGGKTRDLGGPGVQKADDGLIRVFHAFQVDTADAERDTEDIGIFGSVPDAILGIAQYVLLDIARDHADWFLSGSAELPWGLPHEDEIESMQLDWRRSSAWLRQHSPGQLIDWYRRAHVDLELFVIPRLLCADSPSLEEEDVMALGADRYRLENLYLLRSENLLPRL